MDHLEPPVMLEHQAMLEFLVKLEPLEPLAMLVLMA